VQWPVHTLALPLTHTVCGTQGADLAFVFSADAAATAIKTYSPELIVVPCVRGRGPVSSHHG
jgi:NAD(P)H-hydrate repair Nnr-like enzyme with NAD(P)H-hydrate dehydratase domain